MTFYDVPLRVESHPNENSTDLLLERLKANPNHALFSRQNQDGTWRNVTTQEFYEEVKSLAKGLIHEGIKPGQAVAIMSRTRYEWTLIDFAIWWAGAISVPIYESSSASQIQWILSDSDAVALFIENDEHLERFGKIRSETPRVEKVWRIDSTDYSNLHKNGEKVGEDELENARSNAELSDLATIVYTSGTTGTQRAAS